MSRSRMVDVRVSAVTEGSYVIYRGSLGADAARFGVVIELVWETGARRRVSTGREFSTWRRARVEWESGTRGRVSIVDVDRLLVVPRGGVVLIPCACAACNMHAQDSYGEVNPLHHTVSVEVVREEAEIEVEQADVRVTIKPEYLAEIEERRRRDDPFERMIDRETAVLRISKYVRPFRAEDL